jgi:hypothetical protein
MPAFRNSGTHELRQVCNSYDQCCKDNHDREHKEQFSCPRDGCQRLHTARKCWCQDPVLKRCRGGERDELFRRRTATLAIRKQAVAKQTEASRYSDSSASYIHASWFFRWLMFAIIRRCIRSKSLWVQAFSG